MVRPSKVAEFLTPLAASWDPSLALVMGGALLAATPAFQLALRRFVGVRQPLTCSSWGLPKSSAIDAELLTGAALFGAGWGMTGMCPGPGIVDLVAVPSPQMAMWFAAMLAGMWGHGRVHAPLRRALCGPA